MLRHVHQLLLGGRNIKAWLALAGYFRINILYSVTGFKNIPFGDMVILTAGFVLEVYYGAVNTNKFRWRSCKSSFG